MNRKMQKQALSLISKIRRADYAAFNSFDRMHRYDSGKTMETEKQRFENNSQKFEDHLEELEQLIRQAV